LTKLVWSTLIKTYLINTN